VWRWSRHVFLKEFNEGATVFLGATWDRAQPSGGERISVNPPLLVMGTTETSSDSSFPANCAICHKDTVAEKG
jgi:hypothetical protein